uniref:Glycosyl transferase family 25 domain-containing protein n=1 Tax=viral metagenome TaxID=1070528 RepID=A0A6C0HJW4_9ZZZZ
MCKKKEMPESKFGFVDHVVYINLDHRTDRWDQILAELAPHFPPEKVTRFSAIQRENGALGCTASHIAVIEMAKAAGWKNVLVVEDDAMWISENFEEAYATLERLAAGAYDTIMLSSACARWYIGSLKLITAQTTAAYLVNSSYYETLLSNFRESRDLLESLSDGNQYALDQYWKRLQQRDNWFVVIPSLMKQRPGYSDIEHKNVDYRL